MPHPSSVAKPSVFRLLQVVDDPLVLNGRPCDAVGLPVALAHPTLGAFLDNVAGGLVPDGQAIDTVLKMSSIMGELSDYNEGVHGGPLVVAVGEYVGYRFAVSRFSDGCRTDSTVTCRWDTMFEAMLVNMELKKELGLGGGCPYLQSTGYYLKFIHKYEGYEVSRLSRLPCLLVYVSGPYFGVAGAVFLGLPIIEPLTPLMPLFDLPHNERLLLETARVLQALKIAVGELEAYYGRLANQASSLETPQTSFPYVDSVRIDEEDVRLAYVSRMDEGANTFRARAGARDVVVKFVKRYSRECHSKCYELGIGPALLSFNSIPGGWSVVVMEWLRGYETLLAMSEDHRVTHEVVDAVDEAVRKMHNEGFVHGDLRLPNVMVGPNNSIKIIDFDWAGRIGEVTYPPLMNSEIRWHPDAKFGAGILPAHDIHLLKSELEG